MFNTMEFTIVDREYTVDVVEVRNVVISAIENALGVDRIKTVSLVLKDGFFRPGRTIGIQVIFDKPIKSIWNGVLNSEVNRALRNYWGLS